MDLDIEDIEEEKRRQLAKKKNNNAILGRRGVNENMKEKLRKETFAPYEQNWAAIAVAVVSLLVAIFRITGGLDSIPVIPVPDL